MSDDVFGEAETDEPAAAEVSDPVAMPVTDAAPGKRGRPKKEMPAPETPLPHAEAQAAAEAEQEAVSAAADLAADTLRGTLRDFILDRLRHEGDKLPWHRRSEFEQRQTVQAVDGACRDILGRVVEIIAAQGRRTVKAKLDSIQIKDGIRAILLLSKFDSRRHDLYDSTGKTVLLVVADPDEFDGEDSPPPVSADQGDIERAIQQAQENADTSAATVF